MTIHKRKSKKPVLPLSAMAQIVDAMHQEVAILDRDMRIVYMNKVKKRIFGSIEGKICWNAFERRSEPCSDCPARHALQELRTYHSVTETKRMGRHSVISVTTTPLFSDKGELVGAVEIVEDITPQVRIESLKLVIAAARSRDEIQHQMIRTISEVLGSARYIMYKWNRTTGKTSIGKQATVRDRGSMAFKTIPVGEFTTADRSLLEAVCLDNVVWIPFDKCNDPSPWSKWSDGYAKGILLCGLPETSQDITLVGFPLPVPPDDTVTDIARQATMLAASALPIHRETTLNESARIEKDFQCPIRSMACPSSVEFDPTLVFVAIGAEVDDHNLFSFCIAPAIAACGRKACRSALGDAEHICEICRVIRAAPVSLVDVSAWSGSTLFKLGMIYGFGKEALLLKRRNAQIPVDLQGMEYIPYDEFSKLGRDLKNRLPNTQPVFHNQNLRNHCFKFGARCHNEEVVNEDTVFVGMPFRAETENVYTAAIRPALTEHGLRPWKADEEPRMIDLMCKVCQGIQSSTGAIINLTGWNPNVLFELGLAFALGKPVFIIRKASDSADGHLDGLDYLAYSDFRQLKVDIKSWLASIDRELET